jgi:hypothetical protein
MRRISIAAGVVGGWLLAAAAGRADSPPPYIEFVRGLRAQGQADLALEYLKKLQAKPPDTLGPVAIELEIAATHAEMAAAEGDDARRRQGFADAKAAFEKFLRDHKDHPLAPQANVEIARLIAVQARDQLAHANRLPEGSQPAELLKARALFEEAADKLGKATALIDAQITKLQDSQDSEARAAIPDLKKAKEQAQLEHGITLLEEAKTFRGEGTAVVKSRGAVLEKGRLLLGELARGEEDNPTRWIAQAWVGKAYLDLDDKPSAAKALDNVLVQRGPASETGRRAAGVFRLALLQRQARDPGPNQLKALQEVQKAAEDWLSHYRTARDTPEGLNVRFALATNLEEQAAVTPGAVTTDPKTKKITGLGEKGRDLFGQAERVYQDLAEGDNEYTERATRERMRLQMLQRTAGGRPPRFDIPKLTTFDECFLSAQLDGYQLNNTDTDRIKAAQAEFDKAKEGLDKLTQVRDARNGAKEQAEAAKKEAQANPADGNLRKAVADAQTAEAEAAKAWAAVEKELPAAQAAFKKADADLKAARAQQHERYGRIIQALTRGLELVTPRDPPKRVFAARNMLTYAYLIAGQPYAAAVMGDHLARSNPRNTQASVAALYALQAYTKLTEELRAAGEDEKAIEADERRLRRLAEFMDRTWPAESATDFARHQLGLILARENRPADAFAMFTRISAGYAGIYAVRHEEGLAAYRLNLPASEAPAAQKQAALKRAIADLETLAAPPDGGDADPVRLYFLGKVRLGYLLLQAQRYGDIDTLAKNLETEIKAAALDDDAKTELTASAQTLNLTSLWGRASQRARDGEHDKVVQLLRPAAQQIGEQLARVPGGEGGAPAQVMLARVQREVLLLDLRSSIQLGQVEEASKLLQSLQKLSPGGSEGGTSAAVLTQIVRDLESQMAQLRRQNDPAQLRKTEASFAAFLDQLAGGANLTPEARLELARGYGSIDQHAKAIDLLSKYPEPKPDLPANDPAAAAFRRIQTQLVRELRLNKQYPEAAKRIDQLRKTYPWAKRNFDLRTEELFILEDQNRLKEAMDNWVAIQKQLLPRLKLPPENQDETDTAILYYELEFYKRRCQYKSYANVKDAAAKQGYLEKFAKTLAAMDKEIYGEPNRKRFADLIADDAQLRKLYVAAGGTLVGPEPPAAPATPGANRKP